MNSPRTSAKNGLPVEMNLLRIVAQGLVPETSASSVTQVVENNLAVQGQQVSSIPHALMMRVPKACKSDVEAAFEGGHLVRSWPMRGTLHVTRALDHHWLRLTLCRQGAWTRQREAEMRLTEKLAQDAADLAWGLIAKEGPLSRAQLFEAWEQSGLGAKLSNPQPAEDRAKNGPWGAVENYPWRRTLLFKLFRDGLLVQGPVRGNEHLLIDARSLPAADSPHSPVKTKGPGSPDHEHALAEVARRYATSHGPVTPADLSRWAGIGIVAARTALASAVELSQSMPDVPALEARYLDADRQRLDHGQQAGKTAKTRKTGEVFYLRADLHDLLADNRKAAEATFFLPSFDELHVGYKDRTCLTDEAGETLICPGKNGMFRPIFITRGRLVAVRLGKELLWHTDPSKRLHTQAIRELESVQTRLTQ
ncbi:MAG: crosslink repair DNA glycosylase YcaQ family protein [Actinomycetaceae bacterium]|nr:crosslink repair DNA glycosylase YcaQ family protein [Actinomycetaceae bacterium]